jgi:demethylmenaquinone methyltransferase/2-methoxy-6-polyprenyl-1,4-benzoquinol methylase
MPSPRAPHPVLRSYYTSEDQRQPFVVALFDQAARHYDRVCRVMSLGSGQWYRGQALRRAGLRPGMRLLDVATGTGLVARAATTIVGDDPGAVVGLDPSAGMLREARKRLRIPLVQGRIETLPFPPARFDVVSIGYALRHAADLDVAFAECRRVLVPGGRIVVLEITRAGSAGGRWAIRAYFRHILPFLMRLASPRAHARLLMRYYWDTIDACVPPREIVEALGRAGFVDVEHRLQGGCLSEYVGVRPNVAVRPRIASSA